MKWTILLLYPDYLAENTAETYCGYVEAETLKDAIHATTEEAMNANKLTKKSGLRRPDDWAIIFACKGHIQNEYAGF